MKKQTAIKLLARFFGYQSSDRYLRSVWKIIIGSLATIALISTISLLYCFIKGFVCDEVAEWVSRRTSKEIISERHLSNHIVFQSIGYRGKTRVVNLLTNKIVMKNIDNVVLSADGDSLAVFFKGKLRGYLNRFTGKEVIPPQYTRAWVFSEGMAAVEENGQLKFINHKGDIVISKGFEVSGKDQDGYLFHNGYCFIRDKMNGKIGVVDTLGNWIIEPQFDYIEKYGDYIHVQNEYCQGLYTRKLEVVFPMEYNIIDINSYTNTILVRKEDEAPQLYDMKLNLLEDFVIDHISYMLYKTGALRSCTDEDGREYFVEVKEVANCNKYSVGGNFTRASYGLMSKSGKILTPPLYSKIEAIAPNRYLCHPHGVILDDNGKEV